jgi:hypothetical protein
MSETQITRLETAESILKELAAAAYSTLCESNGVSDNEWKVKGGKAVPRWPVKSFYAALTRLGEAHTKAAEYFDPIEAERQRKWVDACATASFIVDEFKKDPSNRAASSLHRNIADAINGSLVQTSEDRQKGLAPKTMGDVLNDLVVSGKLTKVKPRGPTRSSKGIKG